MFVVCGLCIICMIVSTEIGTVDLVDVSSRFSSRPVRHVNQETSFGELKRPARTICSET